MSEKQPNYFSYLLRLWREDDDELLQQVNGAQDQPRSKPIWLASLESSLTGRRHGFADLESLFVFLRRKVGKESAPDSDEAGTRGQ